MFTHTLSAPPPVAGADILEGVLAAGAVVAAGDVAGAAAGAEGVAAAGGCAEGVAAAVGPHQSFTPL